MNSPCLDDRYPIHRLSYRFRFAYSQMQSKNQSNNKPKAQTSQKKKSKTPTPASNLKNPSSDLIMAPAAVSRMIRSGPPKVSTTTSNGQRTTTFEHEELVISSIAGSTSFTVQSTLSLNPGLTATFPWLGPQAVQWEEYAVTRLYARYVAIAATSTKGDVIISPDYDASSPAPTTETQAANNQGTVTTNVWREFVIELDPRAMMNMPRKFVRSTLVAGDIKTFDVGKLFIATNNCADTSAVGKLYLGYRIQCWVPQNSPSFATVPISTSFYTQNANQTFTTNVGAPLNWDSLIYDPLGVGAPASGVFTPPAGVYRIAAAMCFSDSSAEAFQVVAKILKNGSALSKDVGAQFNAGVSLGAGEVLGSLSFDAIVPMNGTDTLQVQCTLTGAAGTLTATGTKCQLIFSLA